ncbi:MAG: CAP domain-containing protein [Corynebacterium sp.]|nr:CAP domain-containing protein [Corynebacterium sp.]
MRIFKSLTCTIAAALTIATAIPAPAHADEGSSSLMMELLAYGSSVQQAFTAVPDPNAGHVSEADLAVCPPISGINFLVRPGVSRNAPVRGASLLDTSMCLMSIDQARQALFDAVNEFRTEQNVTPLLRISEADQKAQAWAEKLARENVFYHAPADGVNNTRNSGENIIQCFMFATPRDCALGWKNSPGHYANIMRTDFDRSGMGVARGSDGHFKAVQQFRFKGRD